jgi:UTP--glucose-1-phosphate uridylyltransferase
MSINIAVVPVAGLGTRLLPATKSQPKEMLPVGRKPVVQYVVEELTRVGMDRLLFVTGPGNASIENHFDLNAELRRRCGRPARRICSKSSRTSARTRSSSTRGSGSSAVSDTPFSARGRSSDRTRSWWRSAIRSSACTRRAMWCSGWPRRSSEPAPAPLWRSRKFLERRSATTASRGPGLRPTGCSVSRTSSRSPGLPMRRARWRSRRGTAVAGDLRRARAHPRRQGRRNPADRRHPPAHRAWPPRVRLCLTAAERRFDIGNFDAYFRAFVEFALADAKHGPPLRAFVRGLLDADHP